MLTLNESATLDLTFPVEQSSLTIDDFFGANDDHVAIVEHTPAPITVAKPVRMSLRDELFAELASFRGIDSLRQVFWKLLGYDRLDEPLSLETFSPEVQSQILSASLFAGHDGLVVIAIQVPQGRFTRRTRAMLVSQLACKFPTHAVLIGDMSWSRVVLTFTDHVSDLSNSHSIILSPSTDLQNLANQLVAIRAYHADDRPRSCGELLEGFRTIFEESDLPIEDMGDSPCLDPEELFNRDMKRYSLMSKEETIACLREIEQMGPLDHSGRSRVRHIPTDRVPEYQYLRNRLLTGHYRLCRYVLREFAARAIRSMSISDLIHEGIFGLHRAIDLYESERGYQFSTYAYHWVRQAMQRAIESRDLLIRIPVHCRNVGYRLSDRDYYRLTRILSLSTNEFGVADLIPDHRCPDPAETSGDRDEENEQKAQLDDAFRRLTDRQREIITLRFGLQNGDCHTLEEIAQKFNLTRERIRQIENACLLRLGRNDQLKELEECLA